MGRFYARHPRLSRRDARPGNIAVTKSLARDRAIPVQGLGIAQNIGETNVRRLANMAASPLFLRRYRSDQCAALAAARVQRLTPVRPPVRPR